MNELLIEWMNYYLMDEFLYNYYMNDWITMLTFELLIRWMIKLLKICVAGCLCRELPVMRRPVAVTSRPMRTMITDMRPMITDMRPMITDMWLIITDMRSSLWRSQQISVYVHPQLFQWVIWSFDWFKENVLQDETVAVPVGHQVIFWWVLRECITRW